MPDEKKEINHSIKILISNVLTQNTNYEKFNNYVNEIDPDVMMIMEINSEWLANLEGFQKDYYYCVGPRDDNFGIGIYSKYPFISKKIEYYREISIPSLAAEISVKNKNIKFIGIHPLPPKSKKYTSVRNNLLLEIAEEIRENGEENVILAGDFNLTPWTHLFSRIKKISNLKDTRQGFGIQQTWPTYNPLFLVPIDHCLVGSDYIVIDRYVGKDIGSDHYPVIVELGW